MSWQISQSPTGSVEGALPCDHVREVASRRGREASGSDVWAANLMTLETTLFEQVADAVRSLMAADTERMQLRWHRRGVKVWFGGEKPSRAHYEAQLIPRRHVDGHDGMAIEVGFHAEHKELAHNERLLQQLFTHESAWRSELGDEAQAGVFLGADNWRRVSEVWLEPDLDDPELAFEMAARLVDYLRAIEPILSSDGSNA